MTPTTGCGCNTGMSPGFWAVLIALLGLYYLVPWLRWSRGPGVPDQAVLVDIANALEKRSSRQLKLFVKLLEPVMLLFMAAITLVVVAGLLLPVFKMGSAVG